MNWQKIIEITNKQNIQLQLTKSVQERQIKIAQEKLNKNFPNELKNFYLISNGLSEYMTEIGKIGELIWNIDRLVEENCSYQNAKLYQDIYKSFENILFFGDAGNGDNFGYLVPNNIIISWNHENDERVIISSSLKEFVISWINNEIKI